MSKILAPFSCNYSPNVVDLLLELKCSIVISTYQANKLIFISPTSDGRLVQLARNFEKVMGVHIKGDKLTLATKNKVHIFSNSEPLAATYPKKPNTYDSLFLPRLSYNTGYVDIHDIYMSEDDIYGVNTSFSSIVRMSSTYNWEPVWTPPHISSLASEDRCHLNGFCFDNGKLKYATSLGRGDEKQSWRKSIPNGGILWDVDTNQAIYDDLQMPHSPRMYNQKLYYLESAIGSVKSYNQETKESTEIKKLAAFVRGMAFQDEYMFVGKSKLRTSSSIFKNLDMAQKDIKAGVVILHVPTGRILGEINYLNSVEEIYDVQILPGFIRPNIMSPEDDFHFQSLSIPNATFWAKPNQ